MEYSHVQKLRYGSRHELKETHKCEIKTDVVKSESTAVVVRVCIAKHSKALNIHSEKHAVLCDNIKNRTVKPLLRFEFLAAASMKMVVFWDVAPCSLVDIGRHPGRQPSSVKPW
jgi:hypothetical protein